MGLTSTFSIAKSGLSMAQSAMEISSHNIANVNTPGYSRQRINLTNREGANTRIGPMGTGVDGINIVRFHDTYMTNNLIEKNSLLAKYEAQKISIDSLETFFNESPGNGINDALSDFWDAWQEVANNPEGDPERINLLEKADTLANHIQQIRSDMDDLRQDINRRVEESVLEANSIIQEIADINGQIVPAESDIHQVANDLRDKREELIKDLAELVDINFYEDPASGMVSVMTPKGTPLVSDLVHWDLKATTGEDGDIDVQWERGNGGEVDITEKIETGRLGGLIQFRDQMLDDFYDQFEEFTHGLITEVNRQHTQGVGLVKYTDLTSSFSVSDLASSTIEFPGLDNDLHFQAMSPGTDAHAVGVKFVKAATAGTGIDVATAYDVATGAYNITVTLPVNSNGTVIATAEEVAEAINETRNPGVYEPAPFPPSYGPPFAAGDLIQVSMAPNQSGKGYVDSLSNPDDPYAPAFDFFRLNDELQNSLEFGSEIQYAHEYARLETTMDGTENDLIFTALTAGAPGEEFSVEFVDPGAANQALNITVNGGAISVSLATDSAGQVISTAEEISSAINSHPIAKTMVAADVVLDQTGAGVVKPLPQTYLDRSGSFDLVTYDSDGVASFNTIVVNPDDNIDDVIAQIGETFATGVQGVSVEIFEISGERLLRFRAQEGYEFAFANDTASALTALGVNNFFAGTGTNSIEVKESLMIEPRLIASGRIDSDGSIMSGDNTNALDTADLKDQKFNFSSQTATISEAFNTLIADVGGTTNTVNRNYEFNTTLVDQIEQQRDTISAVNLDEEMADLMKYQYMYQASAKMISVVDELLQTLLSVK